MRVLLVCNAGMSTGIMQMKLQDEAKSRNIEFEVLAVPMTEVEEHKDFDVVLLGPQIRFAENDIKKIVPEDVKVMVISSQDFGLMNAKNVMDMILSQ